ANTFQISASHWINLGVLDVKRTAKRLDIEWGEIRRDGWISKRKAAALQCEGAIKNIYLFICKIGGIKKKRSAIASDRQTRINMARMRSSYCSHGRTSGRYVGIPANNVSSD